MEEDDETQSNPSLSPSPSPPPSATGRITVTVASSNTLTLALPSQNPPPRSAAAAAAGGSGGGGRDDIWSEDATAVLIDAWGERYLQLSRGNLKQQHWQEVAAAVNASGQAGKTPRTDVQCKNRIDTVKKKYKTEKAKIAAGGTSWWRFYHQLDQLIGPAASKLTAHSTSPANQSHVPVGIPVISTRSQNKKKLPVVDLDSDSDHDPSGDSSEGLPPPQNKRQRVMMEGKSAKKNDNGIGFDVKGETRTSSVGRRIGDWGSSVRELSRAVLRFGEAYERCETEKVKQIVEMEKQRMKFVKDMELQRMQLFMKMQLELSQFKKPRRRGNGKKDHGGVGGVDNGNVAANDVDVDDNSYSSND